VKDRFSALGAIILSATAVGCARQPEPSYVSSQQVRRLKTDAQSKIVTILHEHCGAPQAPKLLGSPEVSTAQLRHGEALFSRYCVPCHGVTGDGQGVAGVYMNPKPRDYRPGIFKFTSTTYGSKPLRDDLIRTVKRGIRGTSMPSFSLFSAGELDAVVDYVLALTHRGELEEQLASEVEFSDSLDPARVPELIRGVLDKWSQARGVIVYPSTPMPRFTRALLEKGERAFREDATRGGVGCASCHGPDGRGQMATNVGQDAWGNPTKAADLTSGMLRGGTEPLDIYRHIDAGINGTPMPSFHAALQQQPEMVWNLVGYVLKIADKRRLGEVPDPGLLEGGILKPLPGVRPSFALK
jgi:mono/diheme cytochrome c family protein